MNCLKVKIIGTVLYIYGILYIYVIIYTVYCSNTRRQAGRERYRQRYVQAGSQPGRDICMQAGRRSQAGMQIYMHSGMQADIHADRQRYVQEDRDTCIYVSESVNQRSSLVSAPGL